MAQVKSEPRIVASPEAVEFVREHGGRLYVWPRHHRCCSGRLTVLETSTERPKDRDFVPHPLEGFWLFLDASIRRPPTELRLELGRFPRHHVDALWDGCAWVV